MSKQAACSLPTVETFLMAEDNRIEKSGQMTLVGVFTDHLFAKVWPLRFPKIAFLVRVRCLRGQCEHGLILSASDADKPLAKIGGQMEKPSGKGELAVFTYAFIGAEFPAPGRYVARFSLSEGPEKILAAEYGFSLQNPNPEELYVECSRCKIKYGSGIAAKDPSLIDLGDSRSVCPQCQNTDSLDTKTAFHLPNPE